MYRVANRIGPRPWLRLDAPKKHALELPAFLVPAFAARSASSATSKDLPPHSVVEKGSEGKDAWVVDDEWGWRLTGKPRLAGAPGEMLPLSYFAATSGTTVPPTEEVEAFDTSPLSERTRSAIIRRLELSQLLQGTWHPPPDHSNQPSTNPNKPLLAGLPVPTTPLSISALSALETTYHLQALHMTAKSPLVETERQLHRAWTLLHHYLGFYNHQRPESYPAYLAALELLPELLRLAGRAKRPGGWQRVETSVHTSCQTLTRRMSRLALAASVPFEAPEATPNRSSQRIGSGSPAVECLLALLSVRTRECTIAARDLWEDMARLDVEPTTSAYFQILREVAEDSAPLMSFLRLLLSTLPEQVASLHQPFPWDDLGGRFLTTITTALSQLLQHATKHPNDPASCLPELLAIETSAHQNGLPRTPLLWQQRIMLRSKIAVDDDAAGAVLLDELFAIKTAKSTLDAYGISTVLRIVGNLEPPVRTRILPEVKALLPLDASKADSRILRVAKRATGIDLRPPPTPDLDAGTVIASAQINLSKLRGTLDAGNVQDSLKYCRALISLKFPSKHEARHGGDLELKRLVMRQAWGIEALTRAFLATARTTRNFELLLDVLEEALNKPGFHPSALNPTVFRLVLQSRLASSGTGRVSSPWTGPRGTKRIFELLETWRVRRQEVGLGCGLRKTFTWPLGRRTSANLHGPLLRAVLAPTDGDASEFALVERVEDLVDLVVVEAAGRPWKGDNLMVSLRDAAVSMEKFGVVMWWLKDKGMWDRIEEVVVEGERRTMAEVVGLKEGVLLGVEDLVDKEGLWQSNIIVDPVPATQVDGPESISAQVTPIIDLSGSSTTSAATLSAFSSAQQSASILDSLHESAQQSIDVERVEVVSAARAVAEARKAAKDLADDGVVTTSQDSETSITSPSASTVALDRPDIHFINRSLLRALVAVGHDGLDRVWQKVGAPFWQMVEEEGRKLELEERERVGERDVVKVDVKGDLERSGKRD